MSGIGGSFRRNGDHHSAVVCPVWAPMGRFDPTNYEERAGEMISFLPGLSWPTPFYGGRRV
jgi:hypothetical protein